MFFVVVFVAFNHCIHTWFAQSHIINYYFIFFYLFIFFFYSISNKVIPSEEVYLHFRVIPSRAFPLVVALSDMNSSTSFLCLFGRHEVERKLNHQDNGTEFSSPCSTTPWWCREETVDCLICSTLGHNHFQR